MDDQECRVCLREEANPQISVFKRVNGVAIEEQLQFVTGIVITKDDSFSKYLCDKCLNETCIAYSLKTSALNTDRILRTLERKMQSKVREKVQEIFSKNDMKDQFHLLKVDEEVLESVEYIGQQHEAKVEIVQETLEEQQFIECEYLEEDQIEDQLDVMKCEYLEAEVVESPDEMPTKPATNSKSFFCIHCTENFSFKIGLKSHMDLHEKEGFDPLVCQMCGYKFSDNFHKADLLARQMSTHFAAHEEGKMINCLMCPEVFKTLSKLQEHQTRRHNNSSKPQNKCKGCLHDFTSHLELHKHLIESDGCKESHERPFKCYLCGETFSMGIQKKKHIQTDHQDKAGADCPHCLRCKIPSALAFENHTKTHFAEPRFTCSYCGRSFYESDRLQTHIKRSHENTKFTCFWCQKTFRDKSGIARHILGVHFNVRNHQCRICSKAFTASYNLSEHLFSVHKQAKKFYTCTACNQDFLYRKQFERHRTSNCSGIPNKRRR